MAEGILPPTKQDLLSACGLSGIQFEDLSTRILAGERPFEDRMHAHGHSDEEIAEVYGKIDRWLMQKGIIPADMDIDKAKTEYIMEKHR
jgi:hypothetical protein